MWQRDKAEERRRLELQRLEEQQQLRERNMLNVPLNFDREDKLQVDRTPTVFDTQFINPVKPRKQRKKEPKTVVIYKDNSTLLIILISLLVVAILGVGLVFIILIIKPL